MRSFSPYFIRSEAEAVQGLLKGFDWNEETQRLVSISAAGLIEGVRGLKWPAGQLEDFMRDYALDTQEGLALMTLAEALLRVPDKATVAELIKDKVAAANWLDRVGGSKDWIVKAASVGLFMSSKSLDGVLSKIGAPLVRQAMIRAMGVLGAQFVLGADIEDAMQNAQTLESDGIRMSYDILGEGARTAIDAEHYFEAYAYAIDYVGTRVTPDVRRRPGISVKLSALHPRYEYAQRARCVPEMSERLLALCLKAADFDLALTVDAEEMSRLNISLEIFERVLTDQGLRGWNGFGLAVQAYSKAAPYVIEHVAAIARAHRRRIQIRLVKGAYWDSEIKHAQVEGLVDFPVFTRKSHSDLSYMACAAEMFSHADCVYPMFGTHNAQSVAAVMEMGEAAGTPYEFQRLYGMGQALFDILRERGVDSSVYAPVGPHKDLLPYLVRRLLENGANSSFVNRILDSNVPVDELVIDPVDKVREATVFRHPRIALARDLFVDEAYGGRVNSQGVDLSAPDVVEGLEQVVQGRGQYYQARSVIGGRFYNDGMAGEVLNPADRSDVVGEVVFGDAVCVGDAFDVAWAAFASWSGTDVNMRSDALERAADLLEARRDEFMNLLVREAGKSIADGIGEIREAVDFLRYYAREARGQFCGEGVVLPGPTGEGNRLSLHGRGVFVCISPWNFPLAIFTGQIAAALVAGNCVVAKPAEQTPLIAAQMVALLHEAGVPEDVLNLVLGDGVVGEMIVQHEGVDGATFTGSTGVAKAINRALAAKDGGIVPFIAETGGQNAMIVDSSALPEQVIDDVILSAFGSAGQRCSALRVLYLQSDIANQFIRMLKGAMAEIQVGNPAYLSSDVGPMIDEAAYGRMIAHRESLNGFAKLIYGCVLDCELAGQGHFFAPCAYEIDDLSVLDGEVFGPILHVIRYDKRDLDVVLADIAGSGYGLTLGIHSRIQSFHEYVMARVPVGNVYVNRSQIGAVVGSQPFGGLGLSGTGPKAGGPHYLQRFAQERVVSVDTTAAGGNASLVSLGE